jgi:hypothetical protein
VLSRPIVIHMHRPYASEEAYLSHERFSIEAKSMLLIDQPPLAIDTAVVFDVTLDNGQKPIRAEAKVIGYIEPEGDLPGGLRVRFRRFGAATKAFIDRAVNGTSPPEAAPAADGAPAAASAPVHAPTPLPKCEPSEADDASGIHTKAGAKAVVAPTNREALLARLRGRRVG